MAELITSEVAVSHGSKMYDEPTGSSATIQTDFLQCVHRLLDRSGNLFVRKLGVFANGLAG